MPNVSKYKEEEDVALWILISGYISTIEKVIDSKNKKEYEKWVREVVDYNYEKLGFEPKDKETQEIRQLRSLVVQIKANHSGVASMLNKNNANNKDNYYIETIKTISHIELDNLVSNKDKVELIVKIDVEGFEMNVIKELLKTQLAKDISEIYFEVNERWVNYDDIQILLKSNGYKFFSKTSKDIKHI